MILDIIFLIIVIFAVIKGYRRGLIVGVFSFIAVIAGLAAAIKLSAVVAGYIGSAVNVSDKWLPVISFIIVFILVVVLVRLLANLLEKAVEITMLGWVNKLGGIIFYGFIFIIAYSILLFYAEKTGLAGLVTIQESVTYPFVRPWGPRVIDGFAYLIPFFKDMFTELELFFDGVSQKIPSRG